MPVRSPQVDAYLSRLPAAARRALGKIRAAVHAAAPGCEECLFYGMPAVRFRGEPLVGWRAAAKHGAFHPLSGSTVAACAEALEAFDTSKGTVRFPFDAPLPARLVKLLVVARIEEVTRGTPASGKTPQRTAAKRPLQKPASAALATARSTVARRARRVRETGSGTGNE
jgi:uncharacterized protein YdhG (YjbR/CyaY superfamily)